MTLELLKKIDKIYVIPPKNRTARANRQDIYVDWCEQLPWERSKNT